MTKKEGHGIKQALEGFRVLDLTDEKGFLCGKILADLGADVIKIEKPGGDLARRKAPFYKDVPHPEKSLFWFALNLGKRSVTLNIEASDGQEIFKKLVRKTDFVIESFPPGYMDGLGLSYSNLSKINKRIIMTSISPFGQTGPHKDWKGSDLVMDAMGGHTYLMGDPDRRPIRISYPQTYFIGAAQAAAGSLIAHWWRQTTGEGQYIDVSIQESVVWVLQDATTFWDLTRSNVNRGGPLRRRPDTGVSTPYVWTCEDGYVCLPIIGGPVGGRFLSALAQWIDEEGMADDFLKQVDWHNLDWATMTQEDADPIAERFSAFFANHTMEELFQGAIEKRVILYPVATVADIIENPQLTAREFWIQVKHPELDDNITYPRSPFRLLGSESKEWLRPALIGEHNEEVFERDLGISRDEVMALKRGGYLDKLPLRKESSLKRQALQGIKVVDFSAVGTGPVTAMYLADHGATVLEIESSHHIDIARAAPPMKDRVHGVNRAGWFNEFNRNKYGMELDLRHPRAAEVTEKIISWADIVVENFTPGVMGRLGLGYDKLIKIKPDIIMFSTTMAGQTGPQAKLPGYGATLVALSGFTHLTGWPDRGPVEVYGAYTDWLLPPMGVVAILAALDYRRRTGKGQYIDLSQYEVGISFLAPLLLDYAVNGKVWNRKGNLSSCAVPHNVYRCKGDDRWCAITVFTDREWAALREVMGDPEWSCDLKFNSFNSRKRNEEELDGLIDSWTIQYTPDELAARLQQAGVPAGPVATAEDLFSDPQLKHRQFFQVLNHPEIGQYTVRGSPYKLSKTADQVSRPAPCMGEHTEYACTKLLGMSDEEFVDLFASGLFQ